MKKIVSFDVLAKTISKLKAKGRKVVLCHGVFDLLHVGHIKHFKEAKNLGDVLIVSLTPDKFVNKGPGKPVFNERLRLEAIAALEDVNFVILNTEPTAVGPIGKLKPNIYCKGPDYKIHSYDVSGQIRKEAAAIKKIKGKIIYTSDITFSSSQILNKYGNTYTEQQKSLIRRVKKKYQFSQIRKLIEGLKKIKVLVIGETIIDQYVFCEALGKSGKDPMLVLRDIKMDEYLGGAAAISRHLSDFCNKLSLLSMIGEKGEFLSYILKKLPKNIKFRYIRKKNSPTIIKKRFLDNVSNSNKVLGVYTINDEVLRGSDEKLFNKMLKKTIPNYDLIIVSDYGHGLISNKSANIICQLSKYLALNAQINAANVGHHSMKKYKKANCVIVNEREIRHEMRDKNSKIELLMQKLSIDQNIENLIVTRGTEGSLLYDRKTKKLSFCGAYAKTTVDKIGAGDTMLSILSLCLKSGFDKELSLLTSSLAAAQSVETIGNSEAINKVKILKSIENILK
tara:strand:- start:24614 stop:26137 length:1524 start_codon:yes stop_codon:yes gene_type:complete